MSLGTNLAEDLRVGIQNSTSKETSAANIAVAVNNYLVDAYYAVGGNAPEGSIIYSSSVAGALFELDVPGTAADAAQQWADAVQSYWGSGVVTSPPASAGAAQTAGYTVNPSTIVITASTVSATLQPLLQSIFEDLSGGQYYVIYQFSNATERDAFFASNPDQLDAFNNNSNLIIEVGVGVYQNRVSNSWSPVTDTKWQQIADAIETAVTTIVTAHTEINPPSPPIPITGGIE